MRRYIVLLLITGTVWAQTGLDKLVLKDGTEFLGECAGVTENVVYFKSTGELAYQVISISRIQSLQLKNGKTIIRVRDNYIKKWTILDYKPLSIKDKATYDAKKDARRWLAYPPLALIGAGGLATATFFIGEDIFEINDKDILLPSIIGGGSIGMIGSYYLFNKLDKNKIEAINSFDNEDYEKFYLQEFKKRKSENIILSGSRVGLAVAVVTLYLYHNFSFAGDFYFGP